MVVQKLRLLTSKIHMTMLFSVVIACAAYIKGLKRKHGHAGWTQRSAWVQTGEFLGLSIPFIEALTIGKVETGADRTVLVLLWYSAMWWENYQVASTYQHAHSHIFLRMCVGRYCRSLSLFMTAFWRLVDSERNGIYACLLWCMS